MRAECCHIICVCCFLLLGTVAYGQDSTKKKLSIRALANDVYHNFLKVEKKTHDSVFFQKSEERFRPYAGKVIRKIHIRNLSFGENVMDTSTGFVNSLSRLADNLQANTKNYIVREMLFVQKGQLVDPFRLADNERFLRDQNFIKDARIVVRRVPGSSDSVDLTIRLRDVFSLGGEVTASGITDFRASLYDANFLGMAQRLQYTLLYNRNRNPSLGSEIIYRKTSFAGSFINVAAAYTTIDRGASLGNENETAYYLRLDRPLYTPNARFAGGLELSYNQSANVFDKPDTQFIDYRYRLSNAWLGYNMGVMKQKTYREDNRRRRFISIGFFDQRFMRPPRLNGFDSRYVDKQHILAQLTWYKLNFYSTNFIYGFGRTEDIPVGMMRKITIGPSRTDSLHRLYVGWEFNHWLVDKKKNYWNYIVALGTNMYKKQWQDNSAFLNVNFISRLFSYRRFRLRQFANINYSGIYKQQVYEPLYINNEFGLQRFNTDSVSGVQRISAGTETSIYTRWQILGFRIGFFGFGRATMISPQHNGLLKGDVFPAFGAGIRTRNENLIFGTIEARFTWFPNTVYDVNNISVSVFSNLRVRFTGSFVQAPWFAMMR